MDIGRLKKRKKELGYTNQQLAELSGVPIGTVQKIFANSTRSPRRKTYLALEKALGLGPETGLRREYVDPGRTSAGMEVRESPSVYYAEPVTDEYPIRKEQGEYTLEDYYAWPEDQRIELIDGVIYNMTAPATLHQFITGDVFRQIDNCILAHDGKCVALISPVDVQLDRDQKTMVQPDVIIVCDRDKIIRRCVYGAPEFVLEVLSPSTRGKDQIVKLHKYIHAGCQEYWIVDPEHRRVTVYDFRTENWPEVYSFNDRVPLAISEGKCVISFQRINQLADMLSER